MKTFEVVLTSEEARLIQLAVTDYQLQLLKLLRVNPAMPVRQRSEKELTIAGVLVTRLETHVNRTKR